MRRFREPAQTDEGSSAPSRPLIRPFGTPSPTRGEGRRAASAPRFLSEAGFDLYPALKLLAGPPLWLRAFGAPIDKSLSIGRLCRTLLTVAGGALSGRVPGLQPEIVAFPQHFLDLGLRPFLPSGGQARAERAEADGAAEAGGAAGAPASAPDRRDPSAHWQARGYAGRAALRRRVRSAARPG